MIFSLVGMPINILRYMGELSTHADPVSTLFPFYCLNFGFIFGSLERKLIFWKHLWYFQYVFYCKLCFLKAQVRVILYMKYQWFDKNWRYQRWFGSRRFSFRVIYRFLDAFGFIYWFLEACATHAQCKIVWMGVIVYDYKRRVPFVGNRNSIYIGGRNHESTPIRSISTQPIEQESTQRSSILVTIQNTL